MRHPGRGSLSPGRFLPIANQMGLPGALDALLLEALRS